MEKKVEKTKEKEIRKSKLMDSSDSKRGHKSLAEELKLMHKVGSSENIHPQSLENNRSKILASSSFSNFFLSQTGRTSFPVNQNQNQKKNKHFISKPSHEPLINRDLCSDSNERLDLGISLREWLQRDGSDARMHERMCIFAQIVAIADSAHSEGIALLELRPSSIILLPNGSVRYVGSFTRIGSLSSEMSTANKRVRFGPDNFGAAKKQKFVDEEKMNTWEVSVGDDIDHMEEIWYGFPEGLHVKDLFPFNIYCIGLLLFELCCRFGSKEVHSAAMMDAQHWILPSNFVLESPEEARFCLWLLHPEPSSRPTSRDIIQSELIYGSQYTRVNSGATLCADEVDDVESDLLLHFLVLLKEHRKSKALKLLESIELLEADIIEVEREFAAAHSSNVLDEFYNSMLELNQSNDRSSEISCNPLSGKKVLRKKWLKNISQLGDAYFYMRSNIPHVEMPEMDRPDKDVLMSRDGVPTQDKLATRDEKFIDHLGTFSDAICKFSRYKKFEVCGMLKNDDILNQYNVICSLSFDREEEYVAAAGVSKKIKIFELDSLLNDSVDIQYPVLEMSNKSKFSCICWNVYLRHYLASADYDGVVQIWDASSGHEFVHYMEHQRKAWSIDFSEVDPKKFATGSDDCSVKLWSIDEKNSLNTIWSLANVCSVQFSPVSSNLLAFGSSDYRIYCYDLRLTRIPWCTLAGHGKAVSYVRFLDSETLISASTDNTLKLWDLKKTCFEGLSHNACNLTFSGHTNQKNFVGLATNDGYIACGSETNEVYAYYRSLSVPITSHKFGSIDSISEHENGDSDGAFVSSVCWGRKSKMIAAANSNGCIKILCMV